MRAMLLERNTKIESSPLTLVNLADPEPQTHEIRIKVSCCAICRTDLHVIEGDLPPHQLPLIPGHQVVGVVDKQGPGAKRFRLGERVGMAWLRKTCGRCRECLAGRENLCPYAQFSGYDAHGGYAEYAVLDENYAYPIPSLFTDEQAAPLLCAGIIGFRALQRAQLPQGGRLGIYGFGSSAHIVIQLAHQRGSETYVVTRDRKHQELARELGAKWVGGSGEKPPSTHDSAIIFAPVGSLVPDAMTSLSKGGTLSIAGIHMTDIPPLNYEQHLFYEKNLCSVTANTRQDGHDLLREAASIPILPHIRTYSLRDANRALQDLKNDAIQGTGVLVIGQGDSDDRPHSMPWP